MKRRRKTSRVPGMPARFRAITNSSSDQCVFCFSHEYLYARDAAKLDYENEVEGLIAALETHGYTGMARVAQEDLDAVLHEHSGKYDDAGEDERRRESIIVAALERSWERTHV